MLLCVTECYCVLLNVIVCYWMLLSLTECYCVLLNVIVCYWMLLCVTEYYCVLLNVTVCCWMLLFVTECYCVLLNFIVCYWRLLCVTECYCLLLNVTVCYWMLLCVTECYCVLLNVTVCCWMLLYVAECYSVLLNVTEYSFLPINQNAQKFRAAAPRCPFIPLCKSQDILKGTKLCWLFSVCTARVDLGLSVVMYGLCSEIGGFGEQFVWPVCALLQFGVLVRENCCVFVRRKLLCLYCTDQP
jgi:hypothetical protein